MFLDLSKVQLFVKAGLAAVVQEEMELDPFQKALFIFFSAFMKVLMVNSDEKSDINLIVY